MGVETRFRKTTTVVTVRDHHNTKHKIHSCRDTFAGKNNIIAASDKPDVPFLGTENSSRPKYGQLEIVGIHFAVKSNI